jgi:protein-tyrosine phosphatase
LQFRPQLIPYNENVVTQSVEMRLRAALQRQQQILASNRSGSSSIAMATHGALWMDMTWITGRLALGGGIWNPQNMSEVSRAGVTHIIDMQVEFDDTQLAEPHGIDVLWNPTDDDFHPKPPELFQRGVDFVTKALATDDTRVLIHCAAGVHRAAMMMLAVLCSQGWEPEAAMRTIVARRPVVDFADVYVESVLRFLHQQVKAGE